MYTHFTKVLACAVLGSALVYPPAWAVNKCTGLHGVVVFQDAPCVGKGEALTVRPASGAARSAEGPALGGGEPVAKPPTEAQRIESNISASQKERRLSDLTESEVPRADGAVRVHPQACKEEQGRLERSKGEYVQNLYGKTDAAQKASEQAAAAAWCDTKDSELRERYAALRAECQQLSGCK